MKPDPLRPDPHRSWRARMAVAADLSASVGIIMTNKLLMKTHGFRYPVTLTACHFATTSVATTVLRAMRRPSSAGEVDQPVPLAAVVAFSLLSCGAIILSNASLFLNSVAFYQIMKLATLPFVACLEVATHTRAYTARQVACLFVIMLGVGVTIEGSVRTSAAGALTAAVSVVTTGCHQFFCGWLQSHYRTAPSTLLSQVAPIKAVLLLLCAPTLDRAWFGSRLTLDALTPAAARLAGVTCAFAVVVNLAQYAVIKHYGAGAFQAMSQLKTAAIIYGGSLVFEGRVSTLQAVGALISVGGVSLLLNQKRKADARSQERSGGSIKAATVPLLSTKAQGAV